MLVFLVITTAGCNEATASVTCEDVFLVDNLCTELRHAVDPGDPDSLSRDVEPVDVSLVSDAAPDVHIM